MSVTTGIVITERVNVRAVRRSGCFLTSDLTPKNIKISNRLHTRAIQFIFYTDAALLCAEMEKMF